MNLKELQKSLFLRAPLAQLAEHLTLNQQVAGSTPAGCTKKPENKPNSGFSILKNSHHLEKSVYSGLFYFNLSFR